MAWLGVSAAALKGGAFLVSFSHPENTMLKRLILSSLFSLVGSILDESDNAQEILDRISSKDKNLAKNFKSHSLNFDYFIENELDSLARIFETIPNEMLALSLIEYGKDERSTILEALSPTRRKVIASSMLMNSKASHEEIRKAKLESSKIARKTYQLLQRNKMGKAS